MQFLLENFTSITATGFMLGAIYGLAALGYTMVYGVLKLLNFAHSEVFTYGTFAAVWAMTLVSGHSGGGLLMSALYFLLALIAAVAASGGVALLVERVGYRRLIARNSSRLILLISAVGVSFVLAEILGLRDRIASFLGLDEVLKEYVSNARDNVRFSMPFERVDLFHIFDYKVTNVDIIIVSFTAVALVGLDYFMRRSRVGKGIHAVAQDSDAAALMGVNRARIIQITFFIGGIMAGVAAMMYLLKFGVTRWHVGFLIGIKAFTAAVIGGIGNLRGAVLGGILLGLVENYGSAIFGAEWRDVVAFSVLVLLLVFKPSGLLRSSMDRARV